MLYREMPKNKEEISILGFGCMRLPGKQTNPDEKKSIELIRKAIDLGVNYLDTAWTYHSGKSEVILGKALQDGYRQKVKIADKLPYWLCETREDMDTFLNAQLHWLNDTVIDYYLVHALNYSSWQQMKKMGIIDFLNKAKESNKVTNVGFSFHGPRDDFKKIIDDYNWDFCQIQFNILDKHDQAGIEGLEYAASKNIGVVIMEPLRGGVLANKLPDEVQKIYDAAPVKRSNAEWALRWIWNHPGVISILSGMNTIEQIEENIKIASKAEVNSLSTEEMALIDTAADTFREKMQVPCTGCQYCMPCPKGVNIPFAFTYYNEKYLFNQGFLSRIMYLSQSAKIAHRKSALASECVDCGICVKHCPQNIDIPKELNKVKKEYEGFGTRLLIFIINKAAAAGSKKKKKKQTIMHTETKQEVCNSNRKHCVKSK